MNFRFFFVLAVLSLLYSCSGPIQLFQDPYFPGDNQNVLRQYFSEKEPVIQAGDKITISIWGHEELSIGSVNSSFNSNESTGRWVVVDNDGEVNLPQIGRIKVAGYDIKEINYLLEREYSKLIKDPIINVKVLNHYVTVLGEVNAPGKYQIDNEQVSLVQMIGEARGLSPYAKGNHVRVLRHEKGRLVELRMDMTDLVSVSKYNVQLQPDDIVYVGATKKKGADEQIRRVTSIASILTGIAVVYSVFAK